MVLVLIPLEHPDIDEFLDIGTEGKWKPKVWCCSQLDGTDELEMSANEGWVWFPYIMFMITLI